MKCSVSIQNQIPATINLSSPIVYYLAIRRWSTMRYTLFNINDNYIVFCSRFIFKLPKDAPTFPYVIEKNQSESKTFACRN